MKCRNAQNPCSRSGLHTKLETEVQRMSPPKEPSQVATLLGNYGAKSSASRAKFGSSKMLKPNFRREAELF